MLEAGLQKASDEMQTCFESLRRDINDMSEQAAKKLELLQRSQIYLEQKLLQEMASDKAALEGALEQLSTRLSSSEVEVIHSFSKLKLSLIHSLKPGASCCLVSNMIHCHRRLRIK